MAEESNVTKIYPSGGMLGGGLNGAGDALLGGVIGYFLGAGQNGGGLFGGNGNAAAAAANADLSRQIATLQAQVADNANTTAITGSIGNLAAAEAAANAANQAAVNGLRGAFQQGCCDCKTAILESGFASQLGNCQQTNTILMQAQGLQNTMQQLGMSLGFQAERDACDIKETSTANTQKIIDTLNAHWNLEQQTTIQQLRDEIGRLNQTNNIIAALKTTTTTAS